MSSTYLVKPAIDLMPDEIDENKSAIDGSFVSDAMNSVSEGLMATSTFS
jgi:hypothetical protein